MAAIPKTPASKLEFDIWKANSNGGSYRKRLTEYIATFPGNHGYWKESKAEEVLTLMNQALEN